MLAEHANNYFRAIVPESVELEDLSDPRVWELIAADLHKFDRIVAIREDRKYWADCLVIDANPGAAKVLVLGSVSPLPPLLATDMRAVPQGFDITQEGALGRWMIRRLSDNVVLYSDGHSTFEEARSFLLGHATLRKG